MSEIMQPRPAAVPFGSAGATTQRYPAAAIANPFEGGYGEPRIENAYRTPNGDVIFSTGFSDWYIMPKGGPTAYQIMQSGFAGSSLEFETALSTSVTGENMTRLVVNEPAGQASFGGMQLQLLSDREKSALLESTLAGQTSYVGLPDVRGVEQSFQLPNGEYMVISTSETNMSYDNFRVFKGRDLSNLTEIPVRSVQRYRDGGTTFYKTAEGTIFSPSPFSRDKEPTWTPAGSDEPVTLTRVDADDVSQRIGNNTRIQGVQTWEEYERSSGRGAAPAPVPTVVPDANMARALEQYQQSSGAPAGGNAASVPNVRPLDNSIVLF